MSGTARSADDLARVMEARKALVAAVWSNVAGRYARELTLPRFKPWTDLTLCQFTNASLPEGPVFVPGCGPGHELVQLSRLLPKSTVIHGVDLAPGMVELAKGSIEAAGLGSCVTAGVGDATVVPPDLQPVAGIISIFSLQIMPQPGMVFLQWYRALQPGGVLCITYWPPLADQTDVVWHATMELAIPQEVLEAAAKEPPFDVDIPDVALREGGIVLADESPVFPMHFDSARHYLEVMVEAGPLQATKLREGETRLAEIRSEFLARFGDFGASVQDESAFVIHPAARMVAVQKPAELPAKM